MNDCYLFTAFYGCPVYKVTARHLARTFSSDSAEYARIALNLSPGSLVWRVQRCTRTSIYLIAHFVDGSYTTRRISVDDSPIYVLQLGPVHYN